MPLARTAPGLAVGAVESGLIRGGEQHRQSLLVMLHSPTDQGAVFLVEAVGAAGEFDKRLPDATQGRVLSERSQRSGNACAARAESLSD